MILFEETLEKIGRTVENARKKDKIICKCDYCNKVFERLKHNLERSHKFLVKDSCNASECVQLKRMEVFQKNHGVDNPFQIKEVKDKIIQQNLKDYGVRNSFQRKEIQNKQKQTCIEIYGTSNVFANEEIKEKIKAKMKSNYGVDNPFKNKDVQEKQKRTIEKLYGVTHYSKTDEFKIKVIEKTIKNHGCFPVNNYGKTQKDLQNWLNGFGFNFNASYSLIKGREIDLYDEHKKIAIEYCGLYWHNEMSPEPRDKYYHYNKYKSCLDVGVQLITIFSDEWEKRKTMCKSHIKSVLGVTGRKIHARKCEIKEINKKEGKEFTDIYHIQGSNNLSVVFFGLFFDDELCGVMSLGRHNRNFKSITLDRLCFKEDVQVVGGASKLFKRCIDWAKDKYSEIISFSDNRWSLGKVYQGMNFILDHEYGPDYSYVNINNCRVRLSKQSQKKDTVNCPEGLTELDWATQRGLARIWDCGKKRWKYIL